MSYTAIVKQHFGLLLLGFLAVFSGNLGQTFLVGFFQPAIAESFSLSDGQFGIVYSAVTLLSGFVVFFVGPSLDWLAPRQFAAMVVTGMGLGILFLTISSSVVAALLGLGLIRFCGQGMFTHLGTTMVAKQVTQARGSALALVTLAIPIGEAILPSTVAGALQVITWREVWWVFLAVLLGVWIPMLLGFRGWPDPPQKSKRRTGEGGVKPPRPLQEALFWRLSLMMLSIGIVNTGIFVFQSELIDEFDATPATFAIGFALAAAGRIVGALVSGRMVDRLGAGIIGRGYLLPLMLGLALTIWLQNAYGIYLYMLLSGVVTGMQEPTVTSLLVQLWGSEHLGKLRSTFVAGMVFSSGLAPAVFGGLLDAGVTFTTILMYMLGMVVTGWLLAWQPLAQATRARR